MPSVVGSAGTARRLVRIALCAWGLEPLADDAEIVVTELVSNAVEHAGGQPVRVTVVRPGPGTVRIGVVDRSRVLPVPRVSVPDDEHGRGLAVVDVLAQCWGVTQLPSGKSVWAVLGGGD
ncbi:ATP-binding protein [Actinacidiphila reveromycinica]|uniref:ATP-binding protein n=1 Tax=Actinacidiphila reveromycinica TaxID=659352 RepID=UPI001F3F6016|nr:ATP-binding protein [Streptomyces sp. SN-593]